MSWFVLVSVTLWIVVSFSGQERSTKSPELNTNALRPKSTFGSKLWLVYEVTVLRIGRYAVLCSTGISLLLIGFVASGDTRARQAILIPTQFLTASVNSKSS